MDPDEFLLKHGAEAFNECLAQATDALAFKWKQLVREVKAAGWPDIAAAGGSAISGDAGRGREARGSGSDSLGHGTGTESAG